MLSAKKGRIKYHFLSLCYDSTWDLTKVSRKLTKLNGSKYCYVSLTIQLNISHLFIYSSMIQKFYF